MAGTYIEGVRKMLSGVYTLIRAAVQRASIGTRGIVAYPFTSNWGPINTLTVNGNQPEFEARYNASGAGDLTVADVNLHAFRGKPSRVLGYRTANNAAAKGTVILNDDEAAPGLSLELETLHPSAREFVAVVEDGSAAGLVAVSITEGNALLVKVEASTQDDLIAALNATDFVRVTDSGANLPALTAGAAFAGGNNGATTLNDTHYALFRTEIEADGTAYAFALDTTDAAVLTATRDWHARVWDEGLYVTWVRGGALAWDNDIDAAATVSRQMNSRRIVNVGNGVDGLPASEMAIFVAARVAAVPLNRALTDEIVPYTAVNKKLLRGQREVAKQSGTLVFVQKGDVVMIDEAVNTLTIPGDGESKEMGKIRVANALAQIARDLEEFGESYKRDKSNTEDARELFATAVERDYLTPLQALEVIQPGFFYEPDPAYHGENPVLVPGIEEAYFHADVTPVDSMERIYQKIGVRF